MTGIIFILQNINRKAVRYFTPKTATKATMAAIGLFYVLQTDTR